MTHRRTPYKVRADGQPKDLQTHRRIVKAFGEAATLDPTGGVGWPPSERSAERTPQQGVAGRHPPHQAAHGGRPMKYEIRSLGPWTGPRTDDRRSGAQFRSTWEQTLKLLRTEAEWLGATYLVVQVDADPSDIRLDGMLRARARVGFPGVKVSLDSTYGPLTYATDAYEDWRKNVHAIALSMTALRAVDRYGVSTRGEQYRGWAAIEAGPDAVDVAAKLLAQHGVGVDPFQVRTNAGARNSAYRHAARRHHPDVGGDPDLFRRLTEARDLLEASA